MSQTHGKVLWNELNTRDPNGAKAYYTGVCGWTFDTMPMAEGGDYTVGKLGDDMIAGIFDMTGVPGMEDIPAHWFTYIGVDDVDAASAATKAAGGTIIRDPHDIENVGRIAVVTDPTGAAFGLMTSVDG